jgi:hypothetical protein
MILSFMGVLAIAKALFWGAMILHYVFGLGD